MRLHSLLICFTLLGCGTGKPPISEYGGVRILTRDDVDSIPDDATTEYLTGRFGFPVSNVVGMGAYLRYSPTIDYKNDSYEKIWSSTYWVLAEDGQLIGIVSDDGTAVWPSSMRGKKASEITK